MVDCVGLLFIMSWMLHSLNSEESDADTLTSLWVLRRTSRARVRLQWGDGCWRGLWAKDCPLYCAENHSRRCWPSVLSHRVSSASPARELGGTGVSQRGVHLFLALQQGILPAWSGQTWSILSILGNSLQGTEFHLFVKLFISWPP